VCAQQLPLAGCAAASERRSMMAPRLRVECDAARGQHAGTKERTLRTAAQAEDRRCRQFSLRQRRVAIDWRLVHSVDVQQLVGGAAFSARGLRRSSSDAGCQRIRAAPPRCSRATPPLPPARPAVQEASADASALEGLLELVAWGDLGAERQAGLAPANLRQLVALAQACIDYLRGCAASSGAMLVRQLAGNVPPVL
jgi:hypothetical protein